MRARVRARLCVLTVCFYSLRSPEFSVFGVPLALAPLGTMEIAKLHAKSDHIPEHVFEVCKAGRYRTIVED